MLPEVNLPVFVFVSSFEHLINVLLFHRNRQISHHELEICLCEVFILDFVLLSSKIGRIWICATDHLKKLITQPQTKCQYLEESLVEKLHVFLPILSVDDPAEIWEINKAADGHFVGHVYHLLFRRIQPKSLHGT